MRRLPDGPKLTWEMKDNTYMTTRTFHPESEKHPSPSREHWLVCSHCAGAKHPGLSVCMKTFLFLCSTDILTDRTSQGALPTQLWGTLTNVSHCTAPQVQSQHSLQNWSLRHIGSIWSVDPDQPSSFTAVLEGKQHQLFCQTTCF